MLSTLGDENIANIPAILLCKSGMTAATSAAARLRAEVDLLLGVTRLRDIIPVQQNAHTR